MTPILIGLSGPMGCGKTTVADHLAREHGFAGPLNFADPLKDAICALLHIDRAELERLKRSGEPAFCGRTIRHALQTLGTEWGRQQIASDMWVQLMARHIAHMETWNPSGAGVVIADVRFENEADFIREHGGIVVHIQCASRMQATHLSEQGLCVHENDFGLQNAGNLQALYRSSDNLVARIRGFVGQPEYLPRSVA